MGYVFHGLIAGAPAASEAAVDPLWLSLLPRVADAALTTSRVGPVAYVEAEFFGGIGQQSAVVWHEGHPFWAPSPSTSAR